MRPEYVTLCKGPSQHTLGSKEKSWMMKGQKGSSGGKKDNIGCPFVRTQRSEAFQGRVQWGADNELIGWTETRVPFPAGLLTTLVQSREHMGSLYSLPPKELPANKLFWVPTPLSSSSLRCVAHISGGPCLPLDISMNKVLLISMATLWRFPCADEVRC